MRSDAKRMAPHMFLMKALVPLGESQCQAVQVPAQASESNVNVFEDIARFKLQHCAYMQCELVTSAMH